MDLFNLMRIVFPKATLSTNDILDYSKDGEGDCLKGKTIGKEILKKSYDIH